ncbi:MAG: DNA-directed RNA polymerase subunit omega [Candidatus Aminicenantes bacterium]|nr:DNA-directed RNA polymerase subunit omega [Candidatus Aminicenantes bacterium]
MDKTSSPKIPKSRFQFVLLAAKRAKQLLKGAKPKIKTKSRNPIRIAQEEVKLGLIDYEILASPEVPEEVQSEEILISEEVGEELEGIPPLPSLEEEEEERFGRIYEEEEEEEEEFESSDRDSEEE